MRPDLRLINNSVSRGQRVLDLGRITADFFAMALEHLDQVPVLVERHGAV